MFCETFRVWACFSWQKLTFLDPKQRRLYSYERGVFERKIPESYTSIKLYISEESCPIIEQTYVYQ